MTNETTNRKGKKMAICENCDEQVSMTEFHNGVWLCGVCEGVVDPCHRCGSHDVVYSDHGVDLCASCKANSTPAQKAWLYEQDYSELLESGHPMADEMSLPSNWTK